MSPLLVAPMLLLLALLSRPFSLEKSELKAMQNGKWGLFYSSFARLLSFAGAVVVTGYLFAFPTSISDTASNVDHTLLSLLLLGTSAGFIHGIGFIPRVLLWKLLFSPLFAWPALAFGLIYMLR